MQGSPPWTAALSAVEIIFAASRHRRHREAALAPQAGQLRLSTNHAYALAVRVEIWSVS